MSPDDTNQNQELEQIMRLYHKYGYGERAREIHEHLLRMRNAHGSGAGDEKGNEPGDGGPLTFNT